MKRKQITKKLTLSKNTVANLNNLEMNGALGGATANTCHPEECRTLSDCVTGCYTCPETCAVGCPDTNFVSCEPCNPPTAITKCLLTC